jgi:phospholipid-binding lipoprotein MlaA
MRNPSLIKKFAMASFISLASFQVQAQISSEDPYESFNRSMFEFNLTFHDYVGEPVGKTYKEYVPEPIQTSVSNFFINLRMPVNMANNLLQGNVENALEDFMRFSINTVFGLGGLIDIATPAGLPYEKEDFGQTLYTWGVWKETNFIVLPFLGAKSGREITGITLDGLYSPAYTDLIQVNSNDELALRLTDEFDGYVRVMDLIDTLKTMPDPYVFYRESYIQYRTNLLYDGKPPIQALDDFDFN